MNETTEGTLLNDTEPTDAAIATEAPSTAPSSLEAFDISQVPDKFIDKDTGVVKINDILKSNSELEKTLHSRAPDSYDFQNVFEEHNLVWENDEQEQEVTAMFKEHRISNDAANAILQMYGTRINAMIESYGSPYNQQEELGKLQSAWGSNTDSRLQEVADYLEQEGIPAEVYQTSPLKSAAGMQMLYNMIKNTQGPRVLRTDEMPVGDMETQLTELINNPLYYVQNAEGDKVRKKATELSNRIASKK
jgi:hypothetical protein